MKYICRQQVAESVIYGRRKHVQYTLISRIRFFHTQARHHYSCLMNGDDKPESDSRHIDYNEGTRLTECQVFAEETLKLMSRQILVRISVATVPYGA